MERTNTLCSKGMGLEWRLFSQLGRAVPSPRGLFAESFPSKSQGISEVCKSALEFKICREAWQHTWEDQHEGMDKQQSAGLHHHGVEDNLHLENGT